MRRLRMRKEPSPVATWSTMTQVSCGKTMYFKDSVVWMVRFDHQFFYTVVARCMRGSESGQCAISPPLEVFETFLVFTASGFRRFKGTKETKSGSSGPPWQS